MNRIIDACENITLRAVNMTLKESKIMEKTETNLKLWQKRTVPPMLLQNTGYLLQCHLVQQGCRYQVNLVPQPSPTPS